MSGKKKTQQVVIPRGYIRPGEAAVIEIPRRYQKAPVVVLKRRPEFAQSRTTGYFVDAKDGFVPEFPGGRTLNIFPLERQPTRQEILDSLDRSQMTNVGITSAYGSPQMVPQVGYGTTQPGMNLPPQQQVMLQSTFLPGQTILSPPLQVMPQSSFAASHSMSVFPQHQVTAQPAFGTIQTIPIQQQMSQMSSFYDTSHQGGCSGSRCDRQHSQSCSGKDTDLDYTEKMEKDTFNRNLNEYQRARRKFLTTSKILTAKASRTSDSSCDSCY